MTQFISTEQKKEILEQVFQEFRNEQILDAFGLKRAITELNESSESEVDILYKIFVFTVSGIKT